MACLFLDTLRNLEMTGTYEPTRGVLGDLGTVTPLLALSYRGPGGGGVMVGGVVPVVDDELLSLRRSTSLYLSLFFPLRSLTGAALRSTRHLSNSFLATPL